MISVSGNKFKGIEDLNLIYTVNDSENVISKTVNKATDILKSNEEENLRQSRENLNSSRSKMIGSLGIELSTDGLLYLASFIPKLGEAVPFIGIMVGVTHSQINAIIEYQHCLKSYNDAQNDFLLAQAYHDAASNSSESTVVNVDGVIK